MRRVEVGNRVEQVRQTSVASTEDGVRELVGLIQPFVCQCFPQFDRIGASRNDEATVLTHVEGTAKRRHWTSHVSIETPQQLSIFCEVGPGLRRHRQQPIKEQRGSPVAHDGAEECARRDRPLEDGGFPDVVRQRRRQDRDRGRRGDGLAAIQCLLDRSRVDAGRIEPPPELHGIAIRVELNRVRAAAFTKTKADRSRAHLSERPAPTSSSPSPGADLVHPLAATPSQPHPDPSGVARIRQGARAVPLREGSCAGRGWRVARPVCGLHPGSRRSVSTRQWGPEGRTTPTALRQAQWRRRSRPRTQVAAYNPRKSLNSTRPAVEGRWGTISRAGVAHEEATLCRLVCRHRARACRGAGTATLAVV